VRLPRVFRREALLTATEGRDVLLNKPDGWTQDNPWLWYISPPGGTDDPLYAWGNPPPGAEPWWGFTSLPAVTRCTSIICDTISGLPWDVLKEWVQLDRPEWISDPQALRQDGRIVQPSSLEVRLSAVEFWTQWIVAALWLGDGFIYCPVRDSSGAPKPPLWQFHPGEVTIESGRYFVAGEPMAPGEIIHLRGLPPYHNGRGRGVLTSHAQDLGLAITVRRYSSGQYRSGVPAGYLKSSQPHLEEEDAQKLKDKWMEQHGNKRDIAVLNATTDFTAIQVTPLDSALDTAKTWDLRSIALMFGVPPDFIDVPGPSNTYANVESRMIELKQFSLLPWCRKIESVLDAQLPRGTSMKVRTSGLERADTKTRYESYAIALDKKFMTVNEVRLLEDMPPLEVVQAKLGEQGIDTPPPVIDAPVPDPAALSQNGATP
jgi:HK97 family phage portal protein